MTDKYAPILNRGDPALSIDLPPERSEDAMTDKVRVEFDFTEDALASLDELAERIGARSRAETMRRALALLDEEYRAPHIDGVVVQGLPKGIKRRTPEEWQEETAKASAWRIIDKDTAENGDTTITRCMVLQNGNGSVLRIDTYPPRRSAHAPHLPAKRSLLVLDQRSGG